jgi:hypothetical protein
MAGSFREPWPSDNGVIAGRTAMNRKVMAIGLAWGALLGPACILWADDDYSSAGNRDDWQTCSKPALTAPLRQYLSQKEPLARIIHQTIAPRRNMRR